MCEVEVSKKMTPPVVVAGEVAKNIFYNHSNSHGEFNRWKIRSQFVSMQGL